MAHDAVIVHDAVCAENFAGPAGGLAGDPHVIHFHHGWTDGGVEAFFYRQRVILTEEREGFFVGEIASVFGERLRGDANGLDFVSGFFVGGLGLAQESEGVDVYKRQVSMKRTWRSSYVRIREWVRVPSPKKRTPRRSPPPVTPVHAKIIFFPGARSSVA